MSYYRNEVIGLYCRLFELEKAFEQLNKVYFHHASFSEKSEWLFLVQAGLRVFNELNRKENTEALIAVIKEQYAHSADISEISFLYGRICFDEGKLDNALQSFSEARLSAKTSSQFLNSLFGIGIVHFFKQEYLTAQKYLKKCQQESEEIEFCIACLLWLAQVAMNLKNEVEAKAWIEQAKQLARKERNIYLLIQALVIEIEMLNLACKYQSALASINEVDGYLPPGLKCKTRDKVQDLKMRIEQLVVKPGFELVESEHRSTLHCPNNKIVDLTGMKQIKILLKMLGQKRGGVLSKEHICQTLWSQDYHPLEFDNKIYVVIRRLRKIIDDNSQAPIYILNRENGYCLNPDFLFTLFQHKYFDQDLSIT